MCSFVMTSANNGSNKQSDHVTRGKRKISDLENASESESESTTGNGKGKKLVEEETDCEGIDPIHEEEEDDGYKTPSSSENRIPAIGECPPAPRKRRPSRSKRRRSMSPSEILRCVEQLDALEEVQSIFRPASDVVGDGVIDTSNKRTRRDEDGGDDDDNDKDRS